MAAAAPMQVEESVPVSAQPAEEVAKPASEGLAAAAPMQVEESAPVSAQPAEEVAKPASEGLVVPMTALVKPDKPKKSLSAYWIYSNAVREDVAQELKEKGEHPRLGDIMKVIGQRWKDLPEAERKIYDDKAAADRQRFETEMQVYKEACDPSAALRHKYKHLMPQKPLNPQGLFNKDAKHRTKALELLQAEGKEIAERQVLSKLSEVWRDLSPEERTAYQVEHTKLQLEYLEAQKAWQATPEFKELEAAEKAQQEVQKAVEIAMAAAEAQRKEEEERARKRARQVAQKTEETPSKKKRGAQDWTPPPGAKKGQVAAPVCIDEKVLKEASKLGMAAALENLAGRAEIISSRKGARAVLDALKASGGLVNPAKRALLGL